MHRPGSRAGGNDGDADPAADDIGWDQLFAILGVCGYPLAAVRDLTLRQVEAIISGHVKNEMAQRKAALLTIRAAVWADADDLQAALTQTTLSASHDTVAEALAAFGLHEET